MVHLHNLNFIIYTTTDIYKCTAQAQFSTYQCHKNQRCKKLTEGDPSSIPENHLRWRRDLVYDHHILLSLFTTTHNVKAVKQCQPY